MSPTVLLWIGVASTVLGTLGGALEKTAAKDGGWYKLGVVLASLGVDLASLGKLAGAAALMLCLVCVGDTACTKPQAQAVQNVDNAVTDVTGLVCALAPDSPVGQPWVQILCWGVGAVEQGVTLVDSAVLDGGGQLAVTSTVVRRKVVYEFQYPSAGAAAFLAKHKAP